MLAESAGRPRGRERGGGERLRRPHRCPLLSATRLWGRPPRCSVPLTGSGETRGDAGLGRRRRRGQGRAGSGRVPPDNFYGKGTGRAAAGRSPVTRVSSCRFSFRVRLKFIRRNVVLKSVASASILRLWCAQPRGVRASESGLYRCAGLRALGRKDRKWATCKNNFFFFLSFFYICVAAYDFNA